jgi:hypothetical protein
MREVNPGNYQGETVIANDMDIHHGAVVVHLRKDGQEAVQEASRPVTVARHREEERERVVEVRTPPQPLVGAPGQRQSLDVMVENLHPGSRVGRHFKVEGKTVPFAMVSVNADDVAPPLPGSGFAPAPGRLLSATARADREGHFEVRLDSSAVPGDTPLSLHIQASDNQGRVGPVRTMEVIRER